MKIVFADVVMVSSMSLFAGCEGPPPPATGSASPVSPAPSTTIATPLGPSGSVPTGSASAVVRPPNTFTDGQTLTVLTAANAKEIETAKAVVARTKDTEVKAFAEMMITHHGDAQKKLDALGDAPGKREAAPEAKTIEEDTRAAVTRFQGLTGGELDVAYVEAMVRDHEDVLELVDRRMLPVATHAGLKTLLADDLRPTIAKHLERAKELAQKRGSTAGAPSASAGPGGSASAGPAGSASTAPAPTGHPSAGASSPRPR